MKSVAVTGIGLVTSIGLDAQATCAALRAGLANPSASNAIFDGDCPVATHRVPLARPWSGRARHVKLLAPAVRQCLEAGAPSAEGVPLILCLAEPERAGRCSGLERQLVPELEAELGMRFCATRSRTIALGRVGVLAGLLHARELLADAAVPEVIVAAVDSLLDTRTLETLQAEDRLLTLSNSNGFIPGEGGGALRLARARGAEGELACIGLGYGQEDAVRGSGKPLRAEGLSTAIRAALVEAKLAIHDLDFRIADVSGEQFFFKEAAIALGRLLRVRKPEFDLWHPSDGTGETGAVAGIAMVAMAAIACAKRYAPGHRMLLHASADGPARAAAILQYRGGTAVH
jgi:3-oxoacyl-[acyl-carrier-protein] synthase-1